jgi:hypothetical protein
MLDGNARDAMADISGAGDKYDFVQIEKGQNIADYSQFLISKVKGCKSIPKMPRNKCLASSCDEQDQPSALLNPILLQLRKNRRDDGSIKLIWLLLYLHTHGIPKFLSLPDSEFRDHWLILQLNTVESSDKLLRCLLADSLIGRSNDFRSMSIIVPPVQIYYRRKERDGALSRCGGQEFPSSLA